MQWNFETMLDLFSDGSEDLLRQGLWGVERETQRITPNGDLSLTEHPKELGSKLENIEITTDFSESQLELITPPLDSVEKTFSYLTELHRRVYEAIDGELLWPLSMPPRLPEDKNIPIARFDDTPEGREREIYRQGLANRYGKKMQMISGIHFNFSFSDTLIEKLHLSFGEGKSLQTFIDFLYFYVARNFLRYRWLLIYLFGASPTADVTYHSVMSKELKVVKKCCPECCCTLGEYDRFSTSLRVSRFGYSNSAKGKTAVSYNSKEDYTQGIRRLLSTRSRKISSLGHFSGEKQIQLNDMILQKDSEFYSSIRMKQILKKGESQLEAIEKRGVCYSEVRIMDVDPFTAEGVSLQTLRFLQVFMLLCVFEASEPIFEKELGFINKNHHMVSSSGKRPGLKLYKVSGSRVELKQWAREIFNRLIIIAKLMDHGVDEDKYVKAVKSEMEKLTNSELLPSVRIYNEMKERKESFLEFGLRKAYEYMNIFNKLEVRK